MTPSQHFSSLRRQWWNSAPSCDGRELPPYPRHCPGPWLGPLSLAAHHTPVSPPCIVGQVGTSLAVARYGATNSMSQFRWFHKRQRRVLLKDRRACRSPWTTLAEGPTTRELSLPRDNSAARLQLTAPCSSLSLTRFAFRRSSVESLLLGGKDRSVGFPPCGRPRVGHSGEKRFGRGCGSRPTVVPSAS
jgi:hypothetical protein